MLREQKIFLKKNSRTVDVWKIKDSRFIFLRILIRENSYCAAHHEVIVHLPVVGWGRRRPQDFQNRHAPMCSGIRQ